MGRRTSGLAGWVLLVAVATAWPTPIRAEEPSEPKFEIALQANSIVANGSIPGKLWLANPSAPPLASATLHFDGPTPLHLTAVVCTDSAGAQPREIPAKAGRFALGAVGPKHLAPLARSARDVLSRMRQARYDAFRWKFASMYGTYPETP